MFENEIKFINDFTLNKINDSGSFITLEKFLSKDIHPAIKKFVEAEINYLILIDRKKLIENSLFDYSGSEISHYFDLISAEVKRTKKISFEDIKNIVFQAVSFNANFVVRPAWSLSKLIFGNNNSVTVDEVKLILNYIYYYDYLKKLLLAFIAKKKITQINVNEFQLLMNKIDRELFSIDQTKLVDNTFSSIGDYFNIGTLNKSNISIEAIEIFLQEKNLTELLFKLKSNYSSSSKKIASIDEIRKVLNSTYPSDSGFVEYKSDEQIESDQIKKSNQADMLFLDFVESDDFVNDKVNLIEVNEEKEISESNIEKSTLKDLLNFNQDPIEMSIKDDIKLDEKIVNEHKTEPVNEEVDFLKQQGNDIKKDYDVFNKADIEQNETNQKNKKVDEQTNSEQQIDIQNTPHNEVLKSLQIIKHNKDILSFLSQKQINKITDYIFNSDSEEFVNTLETISNKTSCDEAIIVLENLFGIMRVKLKSKEVTALKTAVEKYFNQDN